MHLPPFRWAILPPCRPVQGRRFSRGSHLGEAFIIFNVMDFTLTVVEHVFYTVGRAQVWMGGGGHYKKPPYNASTVQVRTYCTLCTLKNISFIATLAKSLILRQGNYHRTVRVCYCTPSSIFKYKQTRNNNQVG